MSRLEGVRRKEKIEKEQKKAGNARESRVVDGKSVARYGNSPCFLDLDNFRNVNWGGMAPRVSIRFTGWHICYRL